MYTIGQVSEMFNLPVSTLRYYDKEGLFPFMQRTSGIRQFSDTEIAALKLIECLKKSGLEIRNIKQYMKAALFNAPSTIGSYYTSLVSHDMADGTFYGKPKKSGIPDYTCNEGESL